MQLSAASSTRQATGMLSLGGEAQRNATHRLFGVLLMGVQLKLNRAVKFVAWNALLIFSF